MPSQDFPFPLPLCWTFTKQLSDRTWAKNCPVNWAATSRHCVWRCCWALLSLMPSRSTKLWRYWSEWAVCNLVCITLSVPRNEALVARGCAHAPHKIEGLIPWLLLSWKTQPNWHQFQNELPSDEGRELCHFLLHCFGIQIRKNRMASQRNISF